MPRPKLRYLAVPDFRAKGVADARVAPMSIAVLRPESGEKPVHAPTLLVRGVLLNPLPAPRPARADAAFSSAGPLQPNVIHRLAF